MHSDEGGVTDMTKVIGTYRDYANAPKNPRERTLCSSAHNLHCHTIISHKQIL